MLDADLATLYQVATQNLNKAVRRNLDRFPDDFMFQLTKEELENLRFQTGTSRWGGRRYQPCAFTERGVAMLSSVLNSKRAVQVDLRIIRAFILLRETLATHKILRAKSRNYNANRESMVSNSEPSIPLQRASSKDPPGRSGASASQ
jgi:phage regulator Rha-like protein